MNELDYIAIDFETASSSISSACSIGLIGVRNDKVVLEEYYLINPEEEFNDYNIAIHGITPEMVENEDTFDKVWEKIKKYFNTIVIAHNAMFDLSVLKALIEKYGLEVPDIKIACTLKISEKVWKEEIPNHKLSTISSYLGVKHNHHNALSDAYVCYELIKRCERITNTSSIEEVMESVGLIFGKYNKDKFFMPKTRFKEIKTNAVDNYFKGKIVAFLGKPKETTRKKVYEILELKGAVISRAIDRSLDIFIAFNQVPLDKMNVVNKLKETQKLEILNESEFLELIK